MKIYPKFFLMIAKSFRKRKSFSLSQGSIKNQATHIRDFIYLDIERTKSIIAQLEKGLVENRTETRGKSKELSGEADFSFSALLKLAGGTRFLWENQTTETKTLHDHIYNYVEERLAECEQLININDSFTEKDWQDSTIQSRLTHTSHILVKGHFIINDYNYLISIFDKFNDLGEFFAYCSAFDITEKKASKGALQRFRETKSNMQLDDKFIRGFKDFYNLFYKDRLVIKVLPYRDYPNFRFVGVLQESYLRDKIKSIIYKYGTSPVSKWVLFAQIASMPQKDQNTFSTQSMTGSSVEVAMQAVFSALQGLEAAGLSVNYPEIAVTPIAIYRE